jgi:putative Mg2+ transporter-C (MgtC) family protein
MSFLISQESMYMIGQLTLAVVLGMFIGIERETNGKPAGLRTYTLVALGSTIFTLLSMHGGSGTDGFTAYDPSRIASQVVVGVGFIGGGLIFLKENAVYGLTTAAGLWTAAAIGMAVGFEQYAVAVYGTFLVLVVLWLFRFVDNRIGSHNPAHQNE